MCTRMMVQVELILSLQVTRGTPLDLKYSGTRPIFRIVLIQQEGAFRSISIQTNSLMLCFLWDGVALLTYTDFHSWQCTYPWALGFSPAPPPNIPHWSPPLAELNVVLSLALISKCYPASKAQLLSLHF